MKIIFVSNIAWSLYNFRRGLMLELKGRGHEVVFCAADDEYTSRLQALGFRYIPVALERKGTNVLKDLALLFSLFGIYRKERPGMIFHNSIKPNIYGAMAARLAGCRCINTVSGLGYAFIRRTFLTAIIRVLYRWSSACAEKTFFQNQSDLDLFIEEGLIHPGKCGRVAGSGVNTDYFKCDASKRPARAGFCFLYLGRILWDKGIGELVDAFRTVKERHPSARMVFLGMIDPGNPAGIKREKVEDWEREGLVEYLGDTMDVRPYLDACDCVVLPSYREGVPRSLLEAAAMERPVVATDVPGCRDVVEPGVTGLLVQVKDPASLAAAMEAVVSMTPDQRRAMGRCGREKVIREYSEARVIKTYCDCVAL